MKIDHDIKNGTFSIIDLTSEEAGALAGALDFAVGEKKRQGMYEKTREEGGGIEIVEDITRQLLRAEFMR